MTRRSTHIYPFLFAIIPVIRLAAAYPGWADLDDVVTIVAAVLAAAGLAYALVMLATRRWGSRLPPLVLMGVVVLFWGYVRVAMVMGRRISVPPSVLLALWLGATFGVIWWLVHRPALLDRVATFLTLTGGILVVWFVMSIGAGKWRSARVLRQSALVQRLAAPIPARPRGRAGPKRDVYLIVLDEYANAEITGHLFGFDNRLFLDSLRRLGFVVPAVHSNYFHTFLSLPSLLNASHVVQLSKQLGARSVDRTLPDYLVAHNRTAPFVKAQGYRFAFFPTLEWEATRHSPQADVEFHWHGFEVARELRRSGLRIVLIRTSLLKYVNWGGPQLSVSHVKRTLAAIAEIPRTPGPVFTFAHLMSPHEPYIFTRDCRLRVRPAGAAKEKPGSPEEQRLYVEQIECLNRMVLELVTTLLRTSELPPVILLQGDHGSKMLRFDQARSAEDITLAAAKERAGAFGAYFLPDGGSELFGDSVTVVNVVGNVLRYYFGAVLPREPDDVYLSADAAPFAFKRVDFTWLAREDWSGGPTGQPARR